MAVRTTQELASWVLGESPSSRTGATPSSGAQGPSLSDTEFEARHKAGSIFSDSEQGEHRDSLDSSRPEVIEEASEPVSPDEYDDRLSKLKSHSSHSIQHPLPKAGTYLMAGSIDNYSDTDRPRK